MCSNISFNYSGFSLSSFVYTSSKWDITTYLTSMKYSTLIPSSKWISLNVFLFILAWYCLWKKVAFLYPFLNHKLWYFYLQYSSYFMKQTCNLWYIFISSFIMCSSTCSVSMLPYITSSYLWYSFFSWYRDI